MYLDSLATKCFHESGRVGKKIKKQFLTNMLVLLVRSSFIGT